MYFIFFPLGVEDGKSGSDLNEDLEVGDASTWSVTRSSTGIGAFSRFHNAILHGMDTVCDTV
jgi:hypothetical protein